MHKYKCKKEIVERDGTIEAVVGKTYEFIPVTVAEDFGYFIDETGKNYWAHIDTINKYFAKDGE